MRSIATFIVDKRKIIMIAFAVAALMSVFTAGLVKVNSDLYSFLPEDTETRQALEVMDGEFTTYSTAKVMVGNISYSDALLLYHDIEKVDGVKSISFDDSSLHYTHGNAMYGITFGGGDNDEVSVNALEDIEELLSGYTAYYDTLVGYEPSVKIVSEMAVVGVIVVAIVIALLLLTSRSYAEVPVLLISFAAAALLQFGTNFFFKQISYVSNAVTLILQLALAIDYAVIMCNRFAEEKQRSEPRQAMIDALQKGIPEIASSSMTTIGGLIAMAFMQFGLGSDLGRVLIKSILLSMLSVFLLMPGLLLAFNKAIDKTRHRSLVPHIDFAGRFAWKTRKLIPPLFAVMLIVCGYCALNCPFSYNYTDAMPLNRTERQIAREEVNKVFGYNNMMAIVVPTGDYQAEADMLDEISRLDHVTSVQGIACTEVADGYKLTDKLTIDEFCDIAGLDELTASALFAYYGASHDDYKQVGADLHSYKVRLIDLFLFLYEVVEDGDVEVSADKLNMIEDLYDKLSDAKKQLQGPNYSRMLVYCDTDVQSQESYDLIDRIHEVAGKYYDEGVYVAGDATCSRDLEQTYTRDNAMVSILSIAFVFVVILLTFRTVGLPILLTAVIQGSIWINFTGPYLTGEPIFFVGYLIVTAIQMGANIDYAIVVSNRYITLRQNNSKRASITAALNGALPTLLTSGSILAISGLLIGFISSEAITSAIGIALGRGTFVSLLLVLFVLPQLLLWGDGFIRKTTFSNRIHFRVPPIFKDDFEEVARKRTADK